MRKQFVASLTNVFLVTGLAGCGEVQAPPSSATSTAASGVDLAAMRKAIEEKNALFTRAHVTGDQALIDAMFTEDAKSLPPESEPEIGRAAISKLTADYIACGVAEFSEESTDLYGNEELLIDQGNYVMVYGKDKTTGKGKYDLHAQPPRLSRQPCPAVRLSNAPSSSTSPASSMG
jgi:ketosteroid isomerase-like protein